MRITPFLKDRENTVKYYEWLEEIIRKHEDDIGYYNKKWPDRRFGLILEAANQEIFPTYGLYVNLKNPDGSKGERKYVFGLSTENCFPALYEPGTFKPVLVGKLTDESRENVIYWLYNGLKRLLYGTDRRSLYGITANVMNPDDEEVSKAFDDSVAPFRNVTFNKDVSDKRLTEALFSMIRTVADPVTGEVWARAVVSDPDDGMCTFSAEYIKVEGDDIIVNSIMEGTSFGFSAECFSLVHTELFRADYITIGNAVSDWAVTQKNKFLVNKMYMQQYPDSLKEKLQELIDERRETEKQSKRAGA